MALLYLDASALVKLAVRETESNALRSFLGRKRQLVASALVRTEVGRALLPFGADACKRAREVLDRIELVRINDRVLGVAGELEPQDLRSLDAIHLATARILGRVKVVVTYDDRMAKAARKLGFRVASPS